jgi:hypothetical protein
LAVDGQNVRRRARRFNAVVRDVSWQASKWAAHARVPEGEAPAGVYWASVSAAKAALLIMAEAADEHGYTIIAVPTVAQRAQLSRSATIGAMRRLSDQGLIERSVRYRNGDPAQGRTSDGVRLRMGPVQDLDGPPVQDLDEARPDAGPASSKARTLIVNEPIIEPDSSQRARRLRMAPSVGVPTPFPDDAGLNWAGEAFRVAMTALDPAEEAERFRDHHTAKGSRFVDWNAAWRTWVRNAVRFAQERSARSNVNRGGPRSELLHALEALK